MIDHAPEAILALTPRERLRGFLALLAVCTLVPLIGVPLATQARGTGLLPGSMALAVITGPMHVAATGFFYFDPAFRPVIGESRMRCLWSLAWLPLSLAAIGVAGAVAIGPWASLVIFSFHNIWLFHHYQRQNFGLASFISTHVGCGRLPVKVNTALNVAALGAVVALLGTPNFFPDMDTIVPAQVITILRPVGTLIYAVSLVLMFNVFRAEPRLRGSAWLTGALILGVAFFLPTILFTSVTMAFFPPAMAHGAQYILMMTVVSGRSSRGALALLLMCAIGVSMGLVIDAMRVWPALAIGLVQVHFLVDAMVWRLREKRQRAIMNDRFDFLLAA